MWIKHCYCNISIIGSMCSRKPSQNMDNSLILDILAISFYLILSHINLVKPFIIEVNVFDFAFGTILSQTRDKGKLPLSKMSQFISFNIVLLFKVLRFP